MSYTPTPNSVAWRAMRHLESLAPGPDATDRDVPVTTSPVGGPTGAGQPAAAGPTAALRFALWSDGALQIERDGCDNVLLAPDQTKAMFAYLDRLREREVA